jgi:DNA-binding MltR family transcriptional regulator
MNTPSPAKNPREFQGRENFVDEIHGKSDRAVAIIGAALLDSHMEQLLTSFFVDDYDEARALLGSDRPLGTFGARIRIAYLLGLISKEERDDLWAINQIREFFIREMGELTLADDPLREWCFVLRLPNKILLSGETRTPRRLFVFGVALLVRQLSLRIDRAAQLQRSIASDFALVEHER